MTDKKTSEMTFREFIDTSRAANNSTINEFEAETLTRMSLEGFSNEEIYNMPMPKLWGLYLEVIGNEIEKTFSQLAPVIMANPNSADLLTLQPLQKQLEGSLNMLEKLEKDRKTP
jgi:hypothetical protein